MRGGANVFVRGVPPLYCFRTVLEPQGRNPSPHRNHKPSLVDPASLEGGAFPNDAN